MDSVNIFFEGQFDDLIDAQISLYGALAITDQIGLIRLISMQGNPVFFGKDSNGFDTELDTGPKNPNGNLATISYHDLIETLYFHSKYPPNNND